MRNTIKDDNLRRIIRQEYINDNTLLQVEYNSTTKKIIVSVRYVKDPVSGIKECILTEMSTEDYNKSFNEIIRINEQRDSIAIFQKKDNKYYLHGLYDTTEHTPIAEDFKDIVFKNKFEKLIIDKNLILVNKK